MTIDPDMVRAANAVVWLLLLVLCVGLTAASASRSSAYARADRFSLRARLPYGTERTRESVVQRVQASSRATAVTMLVVALAVAPLLLTPLATSVTFPIIAVLPMLVAIALTSAVMEVRERLFHPAPDAPRIARARALAVADYVDPFRRVLPWILAVAAAVAVVTVSLTWLRAPEEVDSAFGVTAWCAALITVLLLLAVPFIDQRVLAQPQPATETLELAWDDAFRGTALGALRLAVALGAWITFALALGALWLGSGAFLSSFATQLPTWGLVALQFLYPSTGRRLRPGLYPDWLRQPAVVRGAA